MSVSENGIQSAMQRLTAAQAEIARLKAERDAAMAGRVKVKPLVQAVNAVLSSAGDEGSRAGLNMGPNGEDIWIDYMEVGKLELDAMATALAAIQPDIERAEPVDGEKLQLSERYQAIYQQACQRVALDEQQGLHLRMGLVSGVVEVCPVCDIAGCHHIRSRAAASSQQAAPKTTEAVAALFRFDARIEWRGHDDAWLVFSASPSGEWVRAADHDILVADLQTLLARVLVMDLGSAEEAAEALDGFPHVIHLVETHHAAHPRPSHPTTSQSPDEIDF